MKIVARFQEKTVVRVLQLLRNQEKLTKSQEAQLGSLIDFYSSFKKRAEKEPRIYLEKAIVQKTLNKKMVVNMKKVFNVIKKNFLSEKLRIVVGKKKWSDVKGFDWLKDIKDLRVRMFVSNEFLQLNNVESFETYAIRSNSVRRNK